MDKPSLQLHPGDWMRDNIGGCSLSAQGLWLRLLFVAHDAERRGYLGINGLPISEDYLARKCGCDLQTYQTLMTELTDAGVPRRTPNGIIYNKRMVEDTKDRLANAERQARFKKKQKINESVEGNGESNVISNVKSNAPVTEKLHASSTSSSSSKKQKKREDIKNISSPKEKPDFPPWLPADDWESFVEHRKALKAPMSAVAQKRVINELEKLHDEGNNVADVINQSIISGWKGVFPLRRDAGRNFEDGKSRRDSSTTGLSPKQAREQRNHEFLKKLAGVGERGENIVDVEIAVSPEISDSLSNRGSVDSGI